MADFTYILNKIVSSYTTKCTSYIGLEYMGATPISLVRIRVQWIDKDTRKHTVDINPDTLFLKKLYNF